MLCGYYLSFESFPTAWCSPFCRLLVHPSGCLVVIAWLYQLMSLPLFVAWGFSFRMVPPLLFLLEFFVVVSFYGSGLFSPSLSPVLELPLVLVDLSLLTRSHLRFPPRRGPPFGPSQFLFGLFALLLVRSSFAHLSTFLYVCIILLLYRSIYSLRSLVGDAYCIGGFPSSSVLLSVSFLGSLSMQCRHFLLPSRGFIFVSLLPSFCFCSFLRFLVGLLSFWWPFPSSLSVMALSFLGGFSAYRVASLSLWLFPVRFLHLSCWGSLLCVLRVLLFLASIGYVPAFFWFPSFVTRSNLSSFATGSSLRTESPLSVVS